MNPKSLARRLYKANRGNRKTPGRSWQTIADEEYQGKVNRAVLCRLALSKGQWIPKDENLLIILGLKKAPQRAEEKRPIFDRPTPVLLWQLINREVMQ